MDEQIKPARYLRISSLTQSTQRQESKIKKGEKVFTDRVSGAIPFKDRPAAKLLIEAIEANEINFLTVQEISRLGRNTFDIQETLEYLNEREITLQVENLGDLKSLVDGKPNPMFKLIVDVLANISQMTRDNIKEAQAQGIAEAIKDPSKYLGRPKGTGKPAQTLVDENKDIVRRLKAGESIRNIGKITDHSPTHVQKVKKAMTELGLIK